jgi:hypothetical protein
MDSSLGRFLLLHRTGRRVSVAPIALTFVRTPSSWRRRAASTAPVADLRAHSTAVIRVIDGVWGVVIEAGSVGVVEVVE